MTGPKLAAGDKLTQGTFTFIKQIRKIYLDHPNALIMVLWDGRSWRKDVDDNYKAKRESTEEQQEIREAYFKQKRDMTNALTFLGVPQCIADNMEADDLAQIYSRTWKGKKVTLWSGDKDWLQLVDERTDWYDPIMNRHCNSYNFEAFTGYKNAEQFVQAKCLTGDKDEVPGFKGIGPGAVEKMFNVWESFYDFMAEAASGEDVCSKWQEANCRKMPNPVYQLTLKPMAAEEEFEKNRVLADLTTVARPAPIGLRRVQNEQDEEAFKTLCYENAFLSFLKDYDRFLQPFKENKFVRTR
jgi:5'-3' exonuclease